MKKFLFSCAAMFFCAQAFAATYDLTKKQPVYSDATGYGYDIISAPKSEKDVKPFFFSVKVDDGNFKVTVVLGSKKRAAKTTVRAESRRLFVENAATEKGQFVTVQFVVNKRDTHINGGGSIRLRSDSEKSSLNWDDRLTLEFNGDAPAVKSISVEKDTTCTTVFLCGNSTVVDQTREPWASWGQMIPRWFNTNVAFANYAQSGECATSFLAENRLKKIVSLVKKGDYIFVEFGHNDQKEKGPGKGAYYNFSTNLKVFVDEAKAAGATLVFVTPTQRRRFDDNAKIVETHGDYPAAMKAVAEREGVQLIDLHQMTRELFEALGVDNSCKALVHYPANTFPNQPKELADNTHFNPYGAYEVAKCVVNGMKKLSLSIVKDIRSDFNTFDPNHPDDFKNFKWSPAPFTDTDKPEGN